MRFEVTRALDSIERRLSNDPLMTGAVLDLGEAVRLADLDGGRPANLLRVGMVIDALSRHLGDGGVALYAVAVRGLLSDPDLTSNERMVIRRWSDDGLVEVVPNGTPILARLCEVAGLVGQPVITRAPLPGYQGVRFAVVSAPGGAALDGGGVGTLSPRPHQVLGRKWECPVDDCPSFGAHGSPFSGAVRAEGAQPAPHLAGGGVPVCPRHEERLIDRGPLPPAVPMAVRVNGVVVQRFVVRDGEPVTVGRSPDDRDGIVVGPYLDDVSAPWISRNHLRLELRGEELSVVDLSTNGTVVLSRRGPTDGPRPVGLPRERPHPLGEWDLIQLHKTVEVGRADRTGGKPVASQPESVMGEAPTVAMRLPRP